MSHRQPNSLKSDYLMSGRFIAAKPDKRGVGDPARPVHYVSDGTGRDSYVVRNDGGLTNPNQPCDPRIVFKKNLRTYQPIGDYLPRRNYDLANLAAGPSVFKNSSLQILDAAKKSNPVTRVELYPRPNART
jgi:hypothetical protein